MLQISNSSTATDYEISNLRIRKYYPADTFAVLIRGGSFGNDWTLVDPTGGIGTNPVTDSTYTTSNYFVADLDSGDKLSKVRTPSGFVPVSEFIDETGTTSVSGKLIMTDVSSSHNHGTATSTAFARTKGSSVGQWQGGVLDTLHESDFSAGTDGYSGGRANTFIGNVDGVSDGEVSYDDVLKFTSNAENNLHYISRSGVVTPFKHYRMTFKFYIPDTNTHLDGIHLTGTYSGWRNLNYTSRKVSDGTSFGTLTNNNIQSATGSWAKVEATFDSAYNNTNFAFYTLNGAATNYVGADSPTDDIVYFKDFELKELEYDTLLDFSSAGGTVEDREVGNPWGENLVANPEFQADDSWIYGGGWGVGTSIEGGKFLVDGTQTSDTYLRQDILTMNKKYRLTFDLTTNGLCYIYGGSPTDLITTVGTDGQYSIDFTSVGTGSGLYFKWPGSVVSTIDNVSVYELRDDLSVTDVSLVREGDRTTAEFNGTTSKIDTGTDMLGTKSVTVMGWIKPESFGENAQGRILDNGKFIFAAYGGSDYLVLSSVGTTSHESLSNSISLNKWQFVAVTRKSDGKASFYIGDTENTPELNGTADQGTGTPVAGTTNVIIGNRTAGDRTFDGFISDLVVVEGILSTDQIEEYYHQTMRSADATYFDGNAYINCGTDSELAFGSGDHSFSAWVKPASFTNAYNYIVSVGNNATGQQSGFGITSGGVLFHSAYSSPLKTFSSAPISTDEWQHVVLVHSGGTSSVYVDGEWKQDQSITMNVQIGKCYIGVHTGDASNFSSGLVRDVRVYDRALTADEVGSLYSTTK